jgi:hypothetical protein
MNEPKTMGELMAEEEARLLAEASTPERIAADLEQIERNAAKREAEVEALRRQGMLDEGGDEDGDEDEDEDEGSDDDE